MQIIPLVLRGAKGEEVNDSSPSQVTSDWIEIVDGRVNGCY